MEGENKNWEQATGEGHDAPLTGVKAEATSSPTMQAGTPEENKTASVATSVADGTASTEATTAKQEEEKKREQEKRFALYREQEEQKIRLRVQQREAKRRAKQIRREERRKSRQLSSAKSGHRVAFVACGLAAVIFGGVLGGVYSNLMMQRQFQELRDELSGRREETSKSSAAETQSRDQAHETKAAATQDKDKAGTEGSASTEQTAGSVAESEAKAVTPKPDQQSVKTSASVELSIPTIAKAAVPAVVAVFTENTVRTPFGDAQVGGAGSGVIIDAKGYVVTNNHVVESGGKISVKLASGKEEKAEIVATDPANDIAVLKLSDDKEYPYIEMADSDTVVIGERTVAIGNPLGNLEGTVTAGIVSAMGREVSTRSEVTGNVVTIENAIQTDASINSGNSGGALLNGEGKLIGINSVKASRTSSGDSVDGIGFAIPSNQVKEIVSRFINYDEKGRPSFGIVGMPLTQEQAEPFGYPAGILIRKLTPGSGAEAAGLQVNDIITEVDGKKVSTIQDMNQVKVKHAAGDVVEVKYFRNGKEAVTKLTLKKMEN